jgi:polar amino acid transport system ATP-binding protein
MEIKINDFKLVKNNIKILDIPELSISNSQTLAVLGPSGSGKSTLIQALSGQEEFSGEILIDNVSVGSEVYFNELKPKISYVFQKNNLFPNLKVIDNLILPLQENLKIDVVTANKKALETLTLLGVGELANKYPSQISGGQEQRVAIARSLCLEAKYIILDEPTSALDPVLTKEVYLLLKKIRDENTNTNMIVVTHNVSLAKKLGDHFIFVDRKSGASSGKIESLNEKNPVLKDFLELDNIL